MIIEVFFKSRRLIFSGLAASLGLATVVAPVVITSATAQPIEGPGPIQPDTISAPGTYQECSPYFGLTKDNTDLLSFDVENVDNAVTPTPVIGTNIVPVLTVTDGTQNVECIPNLGWTDEATWQSDYVNGGGLASFNRLLAYPGPGFYLMPAIDGSTTFSLTGGGSILPTASSLRFETNFTGRTITVSPSGLVHTFGGYLPIIQRLTGAQLSDPYYAALSAAVTATGDAAQAAYLLELFTATSDPLCIYNDNNGWELLIPNENFIPLTATLESLGQFTPQVSCENITFSAEVLYNLEVQRAKVPNSLVTLTITDPTATTTTVVENPVSPTFTG